MQVKLVSTDGKDLPLKGFALIPEARLAAFEALTVTVDNYLKALQTAPMDAGVNLPPATEKLTQCRQALALLWDLP